MATSDNLSTLAVVLLGAFYITVFILSVFGNTWVLVTCYKTLKRRRSPFMWLLANLATADLSFTFLSLFNTVGFLWQWFGGNITCKVQGFLLEASYTTSIITLVIVSHQRLKALTNPLNTRIGRIASRSSREFIKLVIIWGVSLAVCSPLVHIYHVQTGKNGEVVCVTSTLGNMIPQIYYSLHTILFFAIPLLYMVFTQVRIFCTLRSSVMPVNWLTTRSNQRNRKVTKTFAALTIAFVSCWSPFMVTRTLIYFHMASPGFVWRASQLLIFLNTGLDPLLYGFFGGNLKSSLRRLMCKN